MVLAQEQDDLPQLLAAQPLVMLKYFPKYSSEETPFC